jgi:hypothetical protein
LAEDKKTLFEKVFSSRKKIQEVKPSPAPDDGSSFVVKELYTSQKELIQGTNVSNEDEEKLIALYRQMENDSVISAALDLYADNSTQVNFKTGHVVALESADKDFEREINAFLWDSVKIDTEAWQMVRDIARDGKLFLDTKVDTSDWSFVPVENPARVQALSYGQDKIKYFVVKPEIQQGNRDPGMYTVVYITDQSNTQDYEVVPRD